MDNVYFKYGCPAKTGNERNLTDYHSRVVVDEYYRSTLKSVNEHDYRKKLQASGTQIIEGAFKNLINVATCKCNGVPCVIKNM